VSAQTPDWRQPQSYEETNTWDGYRWRWEFTRRREDVRRIFDERAEEFTARSRALDDLFGYPEIPITAHDDPNAFVLLSEQGDSALRDSIGCDRVRNPYFQQDPGYVGFKSYPRLILGSVDFDRDDDFEIEVDEFGRSVGYLRGQDKVGVVFDLSAPLEKQLEAASAFLKSRQKAFALDKQRRAHKSKWLLYLRILDAKASGVSHTELARVLSVEDADGWTEQKVRDTFVAACQVRDNFPD
jgi:hypothetical protein